MGYTVPQGHRYIPVFYGDADVDILKHLKFRFPVHTETLESWIKLMDDVTKAALIAILPLLWLDSYSLTQRSIGFAALVITGYFAQIFADLLRKHRDLLIRKDTSC